MSTIHNVCGVLVHTHPERTDEVAAALARIPGVEVHGRAGGARLIVTVEDSTAMTGADALAELNRQPGVIAAALVYHELDQISEEISEDPACGTEEERC